MNLSGKTAIVTGASDGIGKQVAIKLADQGVNLALIGRDNFRLNQVKNAIKKLNSSLKNVSSKSGVTAQAGQSVYSASKWGVRGFTEVLKIDLKNTGIKVAGVYQSGINTKMFEKTGEKVPSEKFTNPVDLAEVIVYILSQPEKIWLHEVRVEY